MTKEKHTTNLATPSAFPSGGNGKGGWSWKWSFLLFLSLLFIFAIGKVVFMVYNRDIEPFSLRDVWDVWRHGLSMDVSVACYLLILPWLLSLVSIFWRRMPMRWFLLPYCTIVAILLGLILGGDTVLYEFWKFKLNAAIFAYMSNPEGATSSVSTAFLITRVGGILLAIALIAWLLVKVVATWQPLPIKRVKGVLLHLLVAPFIFLGIRGSIGTSVMNVGVAYYSTSLFLNHSAVNPAFSLLASFERTKDYAAMFDYLPEEERAAVFAPLYPDETEDITDTLLTTQRPNILIVLMESFGGKFVEELGGVPGVAPSMSRLIPEGIFWDNFYANSFRTDRGTVSTFSGWVSYPTATLMQMPDRLAGIPGLATCLAREGYSTGYLYGGDIKIMGKRGYLVSAGYEEFISDADFPFSEAHATKWGVNDSLTAQRMFRWIASQPQDKPWHLVLQTLSSHEPFEVPYRQLDDKVLNAFAYTDHCVGQLVDSLRTLPQWDQTLVILLPDHGFLYDLTYEDPAFFHCPMLWLGGAIREPRRMSVLMNQSDLCATLLAQMGIRHDDFPWSRNVLSRSYIYPFVYSSFPSGILFGDSTGITVFDITSNLTITEQPSPSPERILKAKALLQTSYDELGDR
ncbi:MAG: LTA synthase family protein [Bacteroidaceae bacterium]|nr:LTA synthase family protein [Bacteroidaceae bacterium]